MDITQNGGIPAEGVISRGISMSDGKEVNASPKDVYLDKINDTEQDKADIEEAKKRVMTPADKRIITLLWILNAAVVVFIGVFLHLSGGADEYSSIREEARFETEEGPAEFFDTASVFAEELIPNYSETDFPKGIINGFKPLYSENKDTAGWIRIEGTNIDHVVLQTDNHSDYDRTTFHGDYYVGGSIYMDYRNKLGKNGAAGLSKNTILYGHYLQNQRGMFSDLNKYESVEYYREHPLIEMSTIYGNFRWKIIGGFIAAAEAKFDNSLFYYWYDNFSDENTLGFANEVAFRSFVVNPSVDVKPTDKFLTLSTCSHVMDIDGKVNARFVIVARLVREGESTDVDVSAAYENPERRMPQYWYDKNGLVNPYSHYAIWDAFA